MFLKALMKCFIVGSTVENVKYTILHDTFHENRYQGK